MTKGAAVLLVVLGLLALIPVVLAVVLHVLAQRRSERHAHGSGDAAEALPAETMDWSWSEPWRVVQTRHQGALLSLSGLVSAGIGLAATLGLASLQWPVPGVGRALKLFEITPTPLTERLMALILPEAGFVLLAILIALMTRAAWSERADYLDFEDRAPGAERYRSGGASRLLGYWDHHRLVDARRSGFLTLWVLGVLATAGLALTMAAQRDAFATLAPAFSGMTLLLLYSLAAFSLPARQCWRLRPLVASPIVVPSGQHVLELLKDRGWQRVPAPGGQAIVDGGRWADPFLSVSTSWRVLPPTMLDLPVAVHRGERPIQSLRWAHRFLSGFIAQWRPELCAPADAAPALTLPFTEPLEPPVGPGTARPWRSTQVVYAPEGSGKAALVCWLAVHNALHSLPPDRDGSTGIGGRSLVLLPRGRGDTLLCRRGLDGELARVGDALRRLGPGTDEQPIPQAGSSIEADHIIYAHLDAVARAIAAGQQTLLEIRFVGVLDLHLWEDIERSQLAEVLGVLHTLLGSEETPARRTGWVVTHALASLDDANPVEAVLPGAADHVRVLRGDLESEHDTPIARRTDLVLLPELRTSSGSAPDTESLLEELDQARIPFTVFQRDAWWPTLRVAPEAYAVDRWPSADDDHRGSHVIIIRDALLPACRRALALLNGNIDGTWRQGELVIFVDPHPWEISAGVAMLHADANGAFGFDDSSPALEEATLGAQLARILALARTWPAELPPHLPRAKVRWGELVLRRWCPRIDLFARHWPHAALVAAAAAARVQHARPSRPDTGRFAPDDGGRVRWVLARRLDLREDHPLHEIHAVDTPTLAPRSEQILVADKDEREPRYVCDTSTYLFQAFPGAVWQRIEGVSAVEWRLPSTQHPEASNTWREHFESSRAAGSSLPLRRWLIHAYEPRPVRRGRFANSRELSCRSGRVQAEPVPQGVMYVDRDGRMRHCQLFDDRALDALPARPRLDTESALLTDEAEPWDEPRAREFAVVLSTLLTMLQPALAVLCDVTAVALDHEGFPRAISAPPRPESDASSMPQRAAWGVLIIDACDGGNGVSQMLFEGVDLSALILGMAGRWTDGDGYPGFMSALLEETLSDAKATNNHEGRHTT